MTDDLRAALKRSHEGDAPPSFDATLARARRHTPRRWIRVSVLATAIVAVAVVVVWVTRPRDEPEPSRLGMATTSLRMPLDSLLTLPDTHLLATTPHLDEGVLP